MSDYESDREANRISSTYELCYQTGDAVEALQNGDIEVLIHQCNLYHTFNSGIAAQIKETYPEAFEADKDTPHGSTDKLGYNSYYYQPWHFNGEDESQMIINMYCQHGHSNETGRDTSYPHMTPCLLKAKEKIMNTFGDTEYITIGMPKIGCGLANGEWPVVEKIIKETLDPLNVTVYTLN